MDPENFCKDQEILDLLKDAGLYDLILKKLIEEDENEDQKSNEKKIQELETKKIEQESLLNFEIKKGGQNLSSGE